MREVMIVGFPTYRYDEGEWLALMLRVARISTISGMLATCVIQPIDMMKVRIQLDQGSAGQVARTMIKKEGFGSLYKDTSPSMESSALSCYIEGYYLARRNQWS